jgi:hypothetical protein
MWQQKNVWASSLRISVELFIEILPVIIGKFEILYRFIGKFKSQ